MGNCIFCSIARGDLPCHKIAEDDHHLAFLSIFPNTEGATVVIPKNHLSSYVLSLPDEDLFGLISFAKKVALQIDSSYPDVGRTALVLEGFGVDHAHAKLFPMHGTTQKEWAPIKSNVDKYFERYEGYISSHDWKRADESWLAQVAAKIKANAPT